MYTLLNANSTYYYLPWQPIRTPLNFKALHSKNCCPSNGVPNIYAISFLPPPPSSPAQAIRVVLVAEIEKVVGGRGGREEEEV